MVTFDRGDVRFNLRAAAVIVHGGRVLLHKEEGGDFWAMPGGRVELLEPAAESITREMREELDVEVRVERPLWLVENFFEHDGMRYHEVAFYFLVSLPPGCPLYEKAEPFHGDEGGTALTFEWHPADSLEDIELFPTFLRESLKALPQDTGHVVHRDGAE